MGWLICAYKANLGVHKNLLASKEVMDIARKWTEVHDIFNKTSHQHKFHRPFDFVADCSVRLFRDIRNESSSSKVAPRRCSKKIEFKYFKLLSLLSLLLHSRIDSKDLIVTQI